MPSCTSTKLLNLKFSGYLFQLSILSQVFLYKFVSIIKIHLKKTEEMLNLDFSYPDR